MTLQEWDKLKVGDYIINIRSNNIYIIIVKHLNLHGIPSYYIQKCNTEVRMFMYNATEWKLLTEYDKVKFL